MGPAAYGGTAAAASRSRSALIDVGHVWSETRLTLVDRALRRPRPRLTLGRPCRSARELGSGTGYRASLPFPCGASV